MAVLLGCARLPSSPHEEDRIKPSRPSWADRREAEIGRQIHQAIISSFRTYTEPRLVGYVTRIGRSLARRAAEKGLSYQFTVLYDDRVYATQAPGGFVYLTTGFLNFMQNEAELASALGYEIAALQFRDAGRSVRRRAMEVITNTGAIAAPLLGQIGALAAAGLVILNAISESRRPSDEEKMEQADRLAIRYLSEANHDPQGYLDLMARLLNASSDWAPYLYDYSLSHPVSIERYQKAVQEFDAIPLEGRSFSVNRNRYLDMTKGVRQIYTK